MRIGPCRWRSPVGKKQPSQGGDFWWRVPLEFDSIPLAPKDPSLKTKGSVGGNPSRMVSYAIIHQEGIVLDLVICRIYPPVIWHTFQNMDVRLLSWWIFNCPIGVPHVYWVAASSKSQCAHYTYIIIYYIHTYWHTSMKVLKRFQYLDQSFLKDQTLNKNPQKKPWKHGQQKSSIAKQQQHSAPSGFVTGQSQHEVSWCFVWCQKNWEIYRYLPSYRHQPSYSQMMIGMSYCWWKKLCKPVEVFFCVFPIIYKVCIHPRWLFGISEPSTVGDP